MSVLPTSSIRPANHSGAGYTGMSSLRRKVENLRHAVLEEEEPDHDAQNTQQIGPVLLERRGEAGRCGGSICGCGESGSRHEKDDREG